MPNPNERLTAADLIRPLSAEALIYFASGEVPVANRDIDALSGKFIRVGGVMLIGADIKFGMPDEYGEPSTLSSPDLVAHLLGDETGLYDSATDTYHGRPLPGSIVHDAGLTRIIVNSEQRPVELQIFGRSSQYGSASPEGRERTQIVAQANVGQEIAVTLNDSLINR
jgi:hypothetical protein